MNTRTSLLIFFAMIALQGSVFAREIAVGGLPISIFPDTETSTNVLLRTTGKDIANLTLRVACDATASNTYAVAFGFDSDGDMTLSSAETDMICRISGSECRIENARTWETLDFLAARNTGNGFAEIDLSLFAAAANQQFQFDREWDMAKIVRRGPDAGAIDVECSVEFEHSILILK